VACGLDWCICSPGGSLPQPLVEGPCCGLAVVYPHFYPGRKTPNGVYPNVCFYMEGRASSAVEQRFCNLQTIILPNAD
jgi:hypothetical protein